jgi:uncharacterized alpha-E superfamily protein
MLSRVANSLYWMSRYIERAENVARSMEVNSHMILDVPGEEQAQWRPLVTITGDDEAFSAKYDNSSQANVIQFLAFDRDNSNSIISCLSAARENARIIRPTIPTEMWECINALFLYVTRQAVDHDVLHSPHEFCQHVKRASQSFQGVMEVTMTHGEGWHFCRLGRSLERADQTTRLLDVKYFILLPTVDHVGLSVDDIQWAAVLRSASAFEMYRQKYGEILPDRVVEFLLLDRYFPRAVLFSLNCAEESLRHITGSLYGTFHSRAEQRLGQLRSELAYTRVDEIIATGLHQFLDNFQSRLNVVGGAIYDSFFSSHPEDWARAS